MDDDKNFTALAEQLTDPSTPMPKGSEPASGARAATHGHDLMLREYGSEAALEEVLRGAGRMDVGIAEGSVEIDARPIPLASEGALDIRAD